MSTAYSRPEARPLDSVFPARTVSKKEGLNHHVYRFGIRKERRLVGVFFAEGPLEDTK